MIEDSLLPFSFPAVGRNKITAAFDGGRITSDAGVMLLGQAERRLGVADKLAAVIADPRNPLLITHSLGSIFRARILAIACGYEDADDLDHLRKDPAFKLACGRLPDTGNDLCSQPTMSRWENAPTLREIVKLSGVLIDLYCASYAAPPQAVTLDIDDTCDVAHGHQQLSGNARRFLSQTWNMRSGAFMCPTSRRRLYQMPPGLYGDAWIRSKSLRRA